MSENRCIYCSPNRPAELPPTDEHVVPVAFGRFRNNLTLPQGVCSACNQFFGNTLDRFLARGSAEAIKRFEYRIKSPEEAGDILKNRANFAISSNDRLNGLRMEYGSENGELVVACLAQVGLRKRDGRGWVYITESELADSSKPLPENIDTSGTVILVFNSDAMEQRLNRLLQSRNIRPTETLEEILLSTQLKPEVLVEIRTSLDEMIFRAIAKIAFNYLTKVAGIDFVVRADFDLIRKYIRYGENPGYPAVEILEQPILEMDSARLRQTDGHLLTLEWSPSGHNLIGQVSLFNFAAYRVTLTHNFSGIWRPIRSGHHFDTRALAVQTLRGIPRSLLP